MPEGQLCSPYSGALESDGCLTGFQNEEVLQNLGPDLWPPTAHFPVSPLLLPLCNPVLKRWPSKSLQTPVYQCSSCLLGP